MKSAVEARKTDIVRSLAPVDQRASASRGRATQVKRCLASDNFISLPAWFPADKAVAVLRSKGKRFALVGQRNGMQLVADLQQLICAPATKSVSWCAIPLGPAVAPTTSLNDVLGLMDTHRSAFLPVVMGHVVVGIIARDSAAMKATAHAQLARQPATQAMTVRVAA